MIHRITNKEILANSVIDLMETKELQSITVQMIVDNCDLSRQTFYYYFKDKYDLVNWIFKDRIDDVCRKYASDVAWNLVLGEMLISMKEYKKFYTGALKSEGQNSFRQYIIEYTRAAYADEMAHRIGTVNDEIEFAIRFNSYGAAGTICNWIDSGMKDEPQKLADRIANSMPEDMKKWFR